MPSVAWEHVTKADNEDKVECNYCSKTWVGLNGSTSNPLKHIKDEHYDKLTDEQKERMSKNNRWWFVILMMQSLMDKMTAITLVLGHNNKSHLILNQNEKTK